MTNRIRAFLSYSIKDQVLASNIKDFFDELGVDTFLAHQTIEASAEWRREIRDQLKRRHLFLVIITRNSHRSQWVDQEIGMAIALGKMVVPMPTNTKLYGFIEGFQAVKTTTSPYDFGKDFWKIVRIVARRYPSMRKRVRGRTLAALSASGNYHRSRDMISILTNVFSPLTLREKRRILRAAEANDQIGGFSETHRFVEAIREDVEGAKRR